MLRTLVPLALIVLVLLGAWCIWPQAEPRALVQPSPDATEVAPARPIESAAKVEAGAPATERAEAGQPAAGSSTRASHLVVLCRARGDQRPLAGVRVYSKYADQRVGYGRVGSGRTNTGKPGEELLADALGRAVFEVEPGRVLSVSADDPAHFVSREGIERIPALAAGETREVQLLHDAGEGARLSGLVLARADGKPVGNAQILVNEEVRTSSDPAGRFELDFSIHVPPWVSIRAQGFGEAVFTPEAGHETPAAARLIELERSASLEIALAMPPGQAAARVVLRAERRELSQDAPFASTFHALPPLEWDADADSLWVCRFTELPPGVRLSGEVVGSTGVLFRTGEPIVLAPAEKKRLEWDLRACELVGHVYEPDGKPAAGIALSLLHETSDLHSYLDPYFQKERVGRATSAEDGSFRFASVSPGSWLLAPEPSERGSTPPAEAIAPAPQRVTIREGETGVTADVHLARGLYIRGQLVAPDGATGAQGYVSAHAEDKTIVSARTDAKGVFTLGPLAPAEFSLTGTPYNSFVTSLPITTRAPAEDVLLRSRAGAEVAGLVIDGVSGTGTQAAITFAGEHHSMVMTRTQPDGSFRMDGLEPGNYTLFASTSDGRAGELAGVVLDPAAPLSGRQVVLVPGAKLRVRYEGAQIGNLSVLRNGAMIGGDGVEGGRTVTQIVPPGKVAVEFRYPGVEQPEVRELEIGAGEEREVLFRQPAGK
jgi:hypothetical protein